MTIREYDGILYQHMRAELVRHDKVTDERGNTMEIKIWRLPRPSRDKPHGCRYSLVYIVNGERAIGYDNGEGKGDHRHYKGQEEPYRFKGVERLVKDFYEDVRRFKK